MSSKVTRRTILAGAVGATSAALLAACGDEAATTAPTAAATRAATAGVATAGATTAATSAASTPAVAAGSSGTVAPAATMASGGMATTGTGVLRPNMMANAFMGKRITFFQKAQYYMAVQAAIKTAVEDYNKSVGAMAEISVQSPDGGPNLTKLQSGVQAGMPFDLGDDIGSGPSQYITLGLLEDMTALVTELQGAYGTVMPIIPRGLQKDGKYYAVPFFTSSDAWFLRKDKLDAKGIKPETLDTYDKMRDAALEISDPAQRFYGWGHSPYAVGDGPTLIFHLIHSYGGSIQNKEGTKVVFNSPETVAAITWLSDLYLNPKYKNMLPPGFESWDGAGNNMAWLNGTIGFTSNAFTLYAKAKDDKNPVFANTFVAKRPKGPATMSAPLLGGQLGYLYLGKGTKNADVARETIKHIMQPDVWNKIAQQAGGLILPAYESQWKNDYWKSDPNYAGLETQVRDPTGYNQSYYPGPVNPGVDSIIAQKTLENMMSSIIQKGVKVQDAVKEADEQMKKIFDQFGIK